MFFFINYLIKDLGHSASSKTITIVNGVAAVANPIFDNKFNNIFIPPILFQFKYIYII